MWEIATEMNDRIETFIAMRVYVCMERGRSAWTPIRPLTPRISANVEVGIGTCAFDYFKKRTPIVFYKSYIEWNDSKCQSLMKPGQNVI